MQFITVASAALAAIPVVQAGSAYIHNTCDFDINVWSVSADGSSAAIPIKAGSSYSEPYRKPSTGGVSLKLMNNTDSAGPAGPVSQFEYTLTSDIWYDMSNVDCDGPACPFAKQGWYLDASDSACPQKQCDAGAPLCPDAYIKFNDDWNTCACSAERDISLYLCTDHKPSTEETPEETPEETYKQAPAVQPTTEEAPAVQPTTEEAPVVQQTTQEAPVVQPIIQVAPVIQPASFKDAPPVMLGDFGISARRRTRRHVRHPHSRSAML